MNKHSVSKGITVAIVFLLTFFMQSSAILAQDLNYRIPNPTRYDNVEELLSAAGSLIRPFFLITFGIMILVGATLLLTSQGQEEKIENAKKTITAAIIGFAIAALAPTFVNFVTSFLGVEGF